MKLKHNFIPLIIWCFLHSNSQAGVLEDAGRKAYFQYNCNGCHGANAKGGMGPPIAGDEGMVPSAVFDCNGLAYGMRSFSNSPLSTSNPNTTHCPKKLCNYSLSGGSYVSNGSFVSAGVANASCYPKLGPVQNEPSSNDLNNIAAYLAAEGNGTAPTWVDWWKH